MDRVIIYVAPQRNTRAQLAGALPERHTPLTSEEGQNVRIKQGLISRYRATLPGERIDEVSRLPG